MFEENKISEKSEYKINYELCDINSLGKTLV